MRRLSIGRGIQRHTAVALICCAGLLEAAGFLTPTAVLERPNFVVILADDLGYGDLGCYGSNKIRTPRIDGMARQGVRFTDFYAPAPATAPRTASDSASPISLSLIWACL